MAEIVWLLEETILTIHQRQIAEHGGSGGLRDHGLLTSAIARPQQLLSYGQPSPDLASLAASYAYGIARNHPFVDYNWLQARSRRRNSVCGFEAEWLKRFLDGSIRLINAE